MSISSLPWVEKYRPDSIDSIVLDDINRTFLSNIIETNNFPNLLLYGPPGTGKTTTIINLVNEYQKRNNQSNKGLSIHLNASDDRGIDTIRYNISQFVNSNPILDNNGMKFVILDEVDYMTKTAQQALKYILQGTKKNNIRFCLICNYITRIDTALKNELIHLRFNNLPSDKTYNFLSEIIKQEKIKINKNTIKYIQKMFKSDIRSMINYIQSNKDSLKKFNIINDDIWKQFKNVDQKKINHMKKKYAIDSKTLFNLYFEYIIKSKPDKLTSDILKKMEFITHTTEYKTEYLDKLFILFFKEIENNI